MKTVHVNAADGYDVHIGKGLLDSCGDLIRECITAEKVLIVADTNTAPLFLDRAVRSFKKSGAEVYSFIFDAGEASKTLSTFSRILECAAESGLTRSDVIAALGGGVTGDIAGFAASCYMRGISFVQLPTTLLAAVDSSVGGKTAVDLKSGKNLAGAFHQPSVVICDTDCLETLSDELLSDGAAEAVKTGILCGEKLFALTEKGCIRENAEEIIRECVEYKARIVEQDEKEAGMRKLLNLGHTIGHAAEKLSDFTVSHGKAVAIGTALITRYAVKEHICSSETGLRIINALSLNGLPVECAFSSAELAEAAYSDKKRSGSSITLVLPEKIGSCILAEKNIADIKAVIEKGMTIL